jgi:transcriptional regulator with GAF, ATPase, and Fis domain
MTALRIHCGDTEPVTARLRDVLSTMADDLVSRLDADACAISRVIGDVLIIVAERTPDGETLQQGQGYLVPDFPQTAEVLRSREPRALTLDDPDLDPAEAVVLRDYGFGALLMLALELEGNAWGLVEVYRKERRAFSAADVLLARELSRVT